MKVLYKMYREQNGDPLIDLEIKNVDESFEVDEKVSGTHLEDLTKEDLKTKLKDLNINEDLKLEIQKGVFNQHIGLFEKNRDVLEDKYMTGKENVGELQDKMDSSFRELEQRMTKEFEDLEKRMRELL